MKLNNLIIFDIDGTLTQTACFDSETFISTFINYFGCKEINSNWHEYTYSTDSGFAIELFRKHLNRDPLTSEIDLIKNQFINQLQKKIQLDSGSCLPIPGAETIFSRLVSLLHCDIAIATGCWKDSAILKLQNAEIPYLNLPLANSDDHIERSEIINIAIERSKQFYNKLYYQKIFYIGDRLWDYTASKKLGIHFIGIGDKLLKENLDSIPIIQNYLNDNFLKYIM